MKKDLVLIKLGGSVLTDKSKKRSAFRVKTIRRLLEEIVEAKKKNNFDLILIHGAGAHPHYLTTKYKINEGFFGAKSAEGVSRVKLELSKLNNIVWQECLRAGLFVWTVPASSVVVTNGGDIKNFDTRVISGLLKLGITPILHGDDVIDEKKKVAVLSGDKTLAYLAKKFKASKVIFVSDVDGVYDKNPKVYKDAKLIKEINKRNFKSIIDSMEAFNKNDASGEMKGKLLAISRELSGVKVDLVGGFKPKGIYNSLVSKSGGTRIFI